MKLLKKLTVAGIDRQIVSESVVLDLASPGRAVFVVQSEAAIDVGSPVTFWLGADGSITPWLAGYVESCRRIDQKQLRLTVREYSAILGRRWPMAQRLTTPGRILAELAKSTGLSFRCGASIAKKIDRSISHFFNIGTGFELMDLLGRVLEVDDYVWLSQADGSIFAGSGAEIAGAATVLRFPAIIFTQLTAVGADCPCFPDMRPGRVIAIGETDPVRIESITLTAEKMRLGFEQC